MESFESLEQRFKLAAPQRSALHRIGLNTVYDLLYHFPLRYERAGADTFARGLVPGTKATLHGTISSLKARKLWKSKRNITEGWLEDASGRVKVMWFNQPYMASYVRDGSFVRLTGMVGGSAEKPYIANPEVEQVAQTDVPQGLFQDQDALPLSPDLFPVYPETRGITSRWIYHALKKIFEEGIHKTIPDPVPGDVRARLNLPPLADALVWIHQPEKLSHAESARKRFSFEEMLILQTARALDRQDNDRERAFAVPDAQERADAFVAHSPLVPTSAQRRAIAEIAADVERDHPMARLLEGDVGAGKTLVAAAAAYAAVTSRPPKGASGKLAEAGTLQVAYMAPTEILAQQHFESFMCYFRDLPIAIGLITGSGCKKFPSKLSPDRATDISRSQLLKWVAGGEIAMVVGTHALIQKSVQFKHLALAIVDEQHRFGTRQRAALAKKTSTHPHANPKRVRAAQSLSEASLSEASSAGHALRRPNATERLPHFLSMTATPIPRTLALTIYGDLDISVLDELPPGRARITTTIVNPSGRAACYEAIRAQLASGRQAYVICPRINEPDPAKVNALLAKSAKAEAARLQKEVFPEFEIGLLHGSMKPDEKDEAMRSFASGETQILVATSVVEVGVNVPNATVILIEGAERFGLAQLHQLRGRVQRSSHPPFCFLLPEKRSDISMKRLRALATSSDGFALAEADLAARGAGDLYGQSQWGVSDLGMEALKNPRLIEAARHEARAIVAEDPTLARHAALAERVARDARTLHAE
jgi:ATP-dependent DNA helicase RecG